MKNEGGPVSILSLVLGIIALLLSLSWFLTFFGFLVAIPGLIMSIVVWKKQRSGLVTGALWTNVLAILVFFVFGGIMGVAELRSSNTYCEYYLPKEFNGWVLIKYGKQNSPPLKIYKNGLFEQRFQMIIPADGRLVTSTPLYEDWHRTRYFFYDEKDTTEFKPETGMWGEQDYRSHLHCEGTNDKMEHQFYFSSSGFSHGDSSINRICDEGPDH